MWPFRAGDSVEQGAGAEREQVEQCRAGVLSGQPRQQVGQIAGKGREPLLALRVDDSPCGTGGQIVGGFQQRIMVAGGVKLQIVPDRPEGVRTKSWTTWR